MANESPVPIRLDHLGPRIARTWDELCSRRWLRPFLGDVLIALVALAILLVTIQGERDHALGAQLWPLLPLTLAQTLPLTVRRAWPLPVLAITVAAAVLLELVHPVIVPPGPVVVLYTVAIQCERRTAIRAGAVTAAVILALIPFEISAIHWLPFCAAAWILGDNLRTRHAYLHELEQRAARLEREREAEARRAVAEEQARIARELHDVIAHNLGVMVVQAAAADDILDTQPEQARAAIRAVRTTGREALTELRGLLDVVRPDEADRSPQPSLSRLDDLLTQVQATGLTVHLAISGEPRPLPAGVELAAYRIMQEALTNILRHAHATGAKISLNYGRDTISLAVYDNGRGSRGTIGAIGRGLIGMRERAALYGGNVEAGPDPAGGFRVAARIPLTSADNA